MKKEDFFKFLNNPHNLYYGHGTSFNLNNLNSILTKGLIYNQGSFFYTSVCLGKGLDILDDDIYFLKNWPYNASRIVVIISLPINYHIAWANLEYKAFGYNSNDNCIRCEFIVGYYDILKDIFIKNSNYYEFLDNKKQEELFKTLKYNYLELIKKNIGLIKYQQELKKNNIEFPLSLNEIEKVLKK